MKKFYLLFLLMLLPLVASADVCALQNEEKEPYAVLSEDNTVLTFYYDDQKIARNGMDVGPFRGYNDDYPSWYGQRENITNVVFDRGGYVYHGRVQALADAAREAGLQF